MNDAVVTLLSLDFLLPAGFVLIVNIYTNVIVCVVCLYHLI